FGAPDQRLVAAFKVATPYSLYVCSEGQNVTLTCKIMGPMAKGHDVTYYKTWYRSSRGEVQVCSERRPIRNLTFQDLHLHHSGHQANTSQDLAQRYGLESVSDHHGNFSITMRNLTSMDSGLYCCLVVEIRHHHSEQRVYGAMELQVHTGEASFQCISYPPSPKESESITAAALATGACIVGILCLPLILLLVYKQRQVATNRRDNNTQGIENPGFEISPSPHGMPDAKARPPLSYMAQRQPSESGRHLLSEPSTPLSPPGPGDVFFPTLDPVPDSPNSEAI
uniref:V-set immunoregulatory receptor n=1 Tax=Canis lupus dingo TaxID=286419 RepID=A0A8C0LI84_CANLU